MSLCCCCCCCRERERDREAEREREREREREVERERKRERERELLLLLLLLPLLHAVCASSSSKFRKLRAKIQIERAAFTKTFSLAEIAPWGGEYWTGKYGVETPCHYDSVGKGSREAFIKFSLLEGLLSNIHNAL
jgi:hypothetical protein